MAAVSATRDFIGEERAAHGATAPQTCTISTEVFANPARRVAGLAALGALARERKLALIVDNPFLSPALPHPLE